MAIQVTQEQMTKILSNCKNETDIKISKINVNQETRGNNMKNKLTDLNTYLFEQLERLNDDDLTDEELEKQIKKTQTINAVATTIVKNADVMLKGSQYLASRGIQANDYSTALMLGVGGDNTHKEENKTDANK